MNFLIHFNVLGTVIGMSYLVMEMIVSCNLGKTVMSSYVRGQSSEKCDNLPLGEIDNEECFGTFQCFGYSNWYVTFGNGNDCFKQFGQNHNVKLCFPSILSVFI